MRYSRFSELLSLPCRAVLPLFVGISFILICSSTCAQQPSDSVSFNSAKVKDADKHTKHIVSVGVEKGNAAPALTSTWLVKLGNEKFGYLSSGYRSIAKSTWGITVRYDRNFQVFKPISELVSIQPCLIAAVNFNKATTQSPRSFLFFPSDAEYSVGEHRSVSFGAGLETHQFVRLFRAGLRLGFVYSQVLDEFEVMHQSGEYIESFKESIIRRANTPFQIVFSINVMIGTPKKDR